MRLLIICPFFPYPQTTGSRIREYNLITRLARQHEIYLFSLIQSDVELGYVGELESCCKQVMAVRPAHQRTDAIDGKRTLRNAVCGIFDKKPIHFYGRPSPNVSLVLEKVLAVQEFDAILVDTLFMTNYVLDAFDRHCEAVPRVLVEHNVETRVQRREISLASTWIEKVRKWVYWATFQGFERQVCSRFDHIIVVSDQEKRLLLRLCPELNEGQVTVVPNGVDIESFKPRSNERKLNTLIYAGSLTYHVNYDAVVHFLQDIFPLVRKIVPDVHLTITGSYEGVPLDSLSLGNHVTLTGCVPDIRPYVAGSTLSIVPVRSGGGTRLKVLESLALGTPVVSTSKGAEGLAVTHGKDILIADEPADFAEAVLRLLDDVGLRQRLAVNGRRLVEERYSWDAIALELERLLCQVVGQGSA